MNSYNKPIMRSIAVFMLLITLCCVLLTGCDKGKDRIEVYSTDYPGLRQLYAKKFSYAECRDWYSADNPYNIIYTCHVSEENGKIVISNDYGDEDGSTLFPCDYGYFLGVNLGEYDGWVRYFTYGFRSFEPEDPIMVIYEACRGFYRRELKDDNALLLTSGIRGGTLLSLTADREEGKWDWEIIAEFDSVPRRFTVGEDGVAYVVCRDSIRSVSPDRNISILKKTDIPFYATVNSMIVKGRSLICGTALGVYEYKLDTSEEYWYPIDYTKYVRIESADN